METDFEEFLSSRGIEDEVIQSMKHEKLDMKTIITMPDVDLKFYLSKYGDRAAVRDYCSQHSDISTRVSLVERLKRKLEEKDGKKRTRSSDDTDISSTKSSPKSTGKASRMVCFGWIRNNVHMRAKSGGGCRRVSVLKSWTKKELLAKASELFFPNNLDSEELKDCKLLDFKRNEFDDDLTVERIFEITRITTCTFYLSTNKVNENNNNDCEDKEPVQLRESPSDNSIATEMNENSEPVINTQCSSLSYESMNTCTESFEIYEFLNFDTNSPNDIIPQNEMAGLLDFQKVTLHRGNVFNELIDFFKEKQNSNLQIDVEMILPNGKKEMAYDSGGVYRDALCEFWLHFYDTCCTGNCFKVPTIRNDYDEATWKAIGRILLQGFHQTNYFPSKIALAFMEQALFGKIISKILDSFLLFLGPFDSVVLRQTLEDPENANYEDVTDTLMNLECRTKVTNKNVRKVIADVAHAELIQKPTYIIDVWNRILRNSFTEADIKMIYETRKVNNRNVVNLLKAPDDRSFEQEIVFGFLKRFVREVDEGTLEKFLRFCTGSNMIAVDAIKIVFTRTNGFQRTPVAHTCDVLLELSIYYQSYNDLRHEFISVLTSNKWVMDII